MIRNRKIKRHVSEKEQGERRCDVVGIYANGGNWSSGVLRGEARMRTFSILRGYNFGKASRAAERTGLNLVDNYEYAST